MAEDQQKPPYASLDYEPTAPPAPNELTQANICHIESVQEKITEIAKELCAICGDGDELVKCKMDALEAIEIFDKVEVCTLLQAIKKRK